MAERKPGPSTGANGGAPAPSKEMLESLNRLASMVNASDDPGAADALRNVAARLGGSGSSAGSGSGGSGRGSRGRRGRSRTRRGSRSGSSRGSRSGSSGSRSSGSVSASGASGSRSRSRSSGSTGSRSRSGSRGSSYSSGGSRSRSGSRSSRGSRSRSRSSGSYSSGTEGASQHTWRPGDAVAVRRPTPYELWSSSHVVAKTKPKRVKKVTRKQWNEIVQRLTDTTRQRHARHLQEQSQAIAEEMSSLSFAPSICQRSREYAQSVEPLHARLGELERKKKNKIDKWRTEDSAKKMHVVTFQPNLQTPCVCGVNVGLEESEEIGIVEDHTPFCLKFMRACATINNKNETQVMSNTMQRNVNHLTQYDEYKRIRAQQRRQIMEEVENRELTFTPQINANSDMLAERFKEKQRRRRREAMAREKEKEDRKARGERVMPSRHDAGHQEETFTPRINRRSRMVAPKGHGRDVYDRLYRAGKVQSLGRHLRSQAANAEARGEEARAQAMKEMAASPVRMAGDTSLARKSFTTRGAASVSSGWSPASMDEAVLPPSPRKSSALVSRAKGTFNTVVYDRERHSFILRRLKKQEMRLANSRHASVL